MRQAEDDEAKEERQELGPRRYGHSSREEQRDGGDEEP